MKGLKGFWFLVSGWGRMRCFRGLKRMKGLKGFWFLVSGFWFLVGEE
jgi:hypothetical protein